MKNHVKEASVKFKRHFYQEYFLQHFKFCSKVSFFHPNNRINEGDSEW